MRSMNNAQRASVWLIAAVFAAGASAQTVIYPAKGQSPDQQKKDEGECHTWAVGQSKYDPANPPPPPATAKPPPPPPAPRRVQARAARRAVRWSAKSSRTTPVPARRWVQRPHAARAGARTPRRRSSNSRPPRSSSRRAWPRTRRPARRASKGVATPSSRSPRQRVDRAPLEPGSRDCALSSTILVAAAHVRVSAAASAHARDVRAPRVEPSRRRDAAARSVAGRRHGGLPHVRAVELARCIPQRRDAAGRHGPGCMPRSAPTANCSRACTRSMPG